MVLSTSEFISIPGGNYPVGISAVTLEKAVGMLRDGAVKKEFIFSSYPEHMVRLDDILIRKFLTTYHEFSEFADETGYITEGEKQEWGWIWQDKRWQKKTGVSWKSPFGTADDEKYRRNDAPVMQVSWNDALAYCSWLSGRFGITVRLPREAEWEVFAGLGGVPGIGEWADGLLPDMKQEALLEAVQTGLRNGRGNSTGILWEWMEDWYDRYPGGKDHRDYGTVYRVLRGGSILSLPVQRTREFRLRKCPTARSPYYGFRIACENAR